jgi:hypothetical protein
VLRKSSRIMQKMKGPGFPRPFSRILPNRGDSPLRGQFLYSSGTGSSATMLMILISGLMAGPAISQAPPPRQAERWVLAQSGAPHLLDIALQSAYPVD